MNAPPSESPPAKPPHTPFDLTEALYQVQRRDFGLSAAGGTDRTKASKYCWTLLKIYSHAIAVSLQYMDSVREERLKLYDLSSPDPKPYAYGNATGDKKLALQMHGLERYVKEFLLAVTKHLMGYSSAVDEILEKRHHLVRTGYHLQALKSVEDEHIAFTEKHREASDASRVEATEKFRLKWSLEVMLLIHWVCEAWASEWAFNSLEAFLNEVLPQCGGCRALFDALVRHLNNMWDLPNEAPHPDLVALRKDLQQFDHLARRHASPTADAIRKDLMPMAESPVAFIVEEQNHALRHLIRSWIHLTELSVQEVTATRSKVLWPMIQTRPVIELHYGLVQDDHQAVMKLQQAIDFLEDRLIKAWSTQGPPRRSVELRGGREENDQRRGAFRNEEVLHGALESYAEEHSKLIIAGSDAKLTERRQLLWSREVLFGLDCLLLHLDAEYKNVKHRPNADEKELEIVRAKHIQEVDHRMKAKGMDKAVAELLKHLADPTLVNLVDGPDFKETRHQAYKFTTLPKILKIVVLDIQAYETWVESHRSAT